ncbi:MAG: hypothetical protein IEMM0008_0061 [bacterium]|nr:MAG: hypothetical protein IEMM0008_0061 [bacterium]
MVLSWLLFVTCLLAGFIASYSFLSQRFQQLEQIRGIVEGSKAIVGLAALSIGLISLISYHIYDFFPAVLSAASGLLLASMVFKYINFSADPEKSDQRKSRLQDQLNHYSSHIGLSTLGIAFVHLIALFIGGLTPFI